MSRMAPFTDGGRTTDRTNWSTTYISYYPFGGAIALALDLTLREQFDGRVTLDDFMRAMWQVHGKPGGSRPGYVDRPYTIADAEARLSEVTRQPGLCPRLLRPLHPRPRGRRLRAAAAPGRSRAAQGTRRHGPGSARTGWSTAASARGSTPRPRPARRPTPPDSIATTKSPSWRASESDPPSASPTSCGRTSPATPSRYRSPTAPAKHDASPSPRAKIPRSVWCRSKPRAALRVPRSERFGSTGSARANRASEWHSRGFRFSTR